MNIAAPDVCLTPVGPAMVPIPYVNLALHTAASKASTIVSFAGMAALNLGSTVPTTLGDEPGVGGGVMSGTFKATAYFRIGSPIVFIENLPAVRVTSLTTGNNDNAIGAVVVPGVPHVLVAFDGTPSSVEEASVLETALLEGSVGFVRIPLMTTDVVRAFFNAHGELTRAGATSFVIDLRGCVGGDLDAAWRLAAEFLPEDSVLGIFVDADGDEQRRLAPRDGPYTSPLVLLVDEGTKSAAEAFVGALAHHARALVIGDRTFGKATAEGFTLTMDGALVKTGEASFRLPDGRSHEGVGVLPSGR